ncbi:unnamed protein product [Oncorhynchus mykiss]|uniref:Peroxisomal carnitine O-octanoyltransferase n=1 Tax=Oncorhynchus mykiss TaxID=8022 RepID=A0A060Y791_ONCMY|nr:unnamed protein product [Oncorhynchus mykiss]
MTNQLSEFPTERTFQYQHSLPPLPVPSLEGSLAKYLVAVRPFATEEEYQVTAAVVKRFGEGTGKDLHQKLLQRARTRRNWLEEWWLNSAYLEMRYPSQLNVNFGGPAPYLEHCWPPTEGVQLQRTSISMWHTLQYWDLLRTERLDPHKAGNVVLDMDQFRMLFCTCKVPGVTKDTIINYFKTESEGPCPSHVVVMCKGRFFSFDAVCDGHILTPPELLRQLTHVKQCCEGEPAGDGIAALTSEERTRWAKAREYLIGIDPANKTILETIQSSLFVVSLDDAKPYATAENYTPVRTKTHTHPLTHYTQKFAIATDLSPGCAGYTCFDCMQRYSGAKKYLVSHQLCKPVTSLRGSSVLHSLPTPVHNLKQSHSTMAKTKELSKDTRNKIVDLHQAGKTESAIGKQLILKKSTLISCNYTHFAVTYAMLMMIELGSCYETAMTRRFYHGRTETMRPCTLEAQNWCHTMLLPAASAEAKRKALLLAFNKHNKLMAEAQNGKGFDRHLLGLYLIAKEEGLPMPDLFTDTLYCKSGGGGNFTLSTSLAGYTTVHGVGAPMVHHGYGFFYRISEDRIVASCSAWKSSPETDAETLFQNLVTSLHEMLHLATTAHL